MTKSTNPVFLLVPGHWHTRSHLTPLSEALEKRGYRSRSLQLHSVGEKKTRPTFSDDVCVIYAAIARELIRGNDVCIVLHGYAGMPGAEAVNHIIKDGGLEPCTGRGRLIRTVFMAAYAFPAGFVMDVRALLKSESPAFEIDNDNFIHLSFPWHNLLNDMPLSGAKPYVDTLAATYYLGPTFTLTPTSPVRRPMSPMRDKPNAFNLPPRPLTPTSKLGTSNPFANASTNIHRGSSPAPPSLSALNISRPSTPTSGTAAPTPTLTTRQKLDAAGPVLSSDAWRKAHVMAICCQKDNLIPAERQEKIWKGMEKVWLEAGHAPFVSRAGEVADVLIKAVEG